MSEEYTIFDEVELLKALDIDYQEFEKDRKYNLYCFTVSELAEEFHTSPNLIRNLIKENKIEPNTYVFGKEYYNYYKVASKYIDFLIKKLLAYSTNEILTFTNC